MITILQIMMIQIPNQEFYLREKEIKPSVTRMKILNFLVENTSHPTVDLIFKGLSPEIPTLSKSTVYNTLKLFLEKGVVQIVNIEDNETRYDADTSFHGHFKCLQCGSVYDFPLSLAEVQIEVLKDFKIDQSHYYLKGKCKKCI
jgi:Fur family peroxide stress response transcriptional regulator